MESLNKHAWEIDRPDAEGNFTAEIVHSKLDNLKTNAKELYCRFRQKMAAVAPAGDNSDDNSYDANGAIATWANFKIPYNLIRPVPGYGPLDTISLLSVSAWANFKIPYNLMRLVPGYGPLDTISSLSVSIWANFKIPYNLMRPVPGYGSLDTISLLSVSTWANFKIPYNLMRPVPGYGSLDTISLLSVCPTNTSTCMTHLSSTRTGTTPSQVSPQSDKVSPKFPQSFLFQQLTVMSTLHCQVPRTSSSQR